MEKSWLDYQNDKRRERFEMIVSATVFFGLVGLATLILYFQ